MEKISISLVDDHVLFRNGIAQLVQNFSEYKVVNQSSNGKEFIEWIQAGNRTDIVILDIQMPVMDGEFTARWLHQNEPKIKVLALSMFDDEHHVLKMIKAGARGYILKNAEPDELRLALDQIWHRNLYHSELVSNAMMKSLADGSGSDQKEFIKLHEKEREFLQFLCSDLTYKEISGKMNVAVRTVDTYRENLFNRFNIKSRIGLVLFAIRNELVKI
jgi:two-component system invasion response regulator UvrY